MTAPLERRFRQVEEELANLRESMRRRVTIIGATVTGTNPLRVHLDDSDTPMAATPDTGVAVSLGDRVRVARYSRTSALILCQMGSTGWIDLSLGSNWSNVSSSEPAQRRKVGDEVQLRGEVINPSGDGGSSDPVTTLPEGWRPPNRMRFIWGWGANITYVHVDPSGVVFSGSQTRPTSPGMFLDVVRFSTAEA